MENFKANVDAVCKDVATMFPGWNFTSGRFKNKSLRHTDLIIDPGFAFRNGTTPVQPGIAIDNKRAASLCKRIFGGAGPVSTVSLQVVAHTLKYIPENFRLGFWVVKDKGAYLSIGQPSQNVIEKTLGIDELRSVLVATLKDGVAFIDDHYDLSGEENLLRALPARYVTRHANSPYDEMDKWKGVMLCIVHILLGDFDFVSRYRSDDFKTIFPKRMEDLDKILAALPDIEKRYVETGVVI